MSKFSTNEVRMFIEIFGPNLPMISEWVDIKSLYDWAVTKCFLHNLQTPAADNLRRTYEEVWNRYKIGRDTPEFEALFVWPEDMHVDLAKQPDILDKLADRLLNDEIVE